MRRSRVGTCGYWRGDPAAPNGAGSRLGTPVVRLEGSLLVSALVPVHEYAALEETAEILSDADALAAIEKGLGSCPGGKRSAWRKLRVELDERRRSR
jgi:hypothetical protein